MGFTEHSATRSTSPLHFLNPVLLAHSAAQCASSSSSYHTHNAVASSSSHSSSANRKRRSASDISRLLDPSYLPATSAKTKRSASVSVYVDPHGEVHDPDYRHFPIAPIHSNHSNYSGHYSNYNYASSSPRRSTSNGRRTTSPRPQFDWELALDESALDDEYPPEPEHLPKHYMNTRHPLTRTPSGARRLPKQRPRESSVSTTGTHTASTTSTSPTGTASTLPTSCEGDGILEAVDAKEDAKDEEEEASPFEDDEKASQARVRALEMEMERERARARNGGWEQEVKDIKEKEVKEKKSEKKRRRLSKSSEKEKDTEKVSVRRVSFDDVYEAPSRTWDAAPARNSFSHSSPSALPSDHDHDHEDAFANPIIDDDEDLPPTTDYTPTCTQSLRRQWQSLALSFRFGVFRARRRVLRRVQSIISV